MKVYFVRHGETTYNTRMYYQDKITPLSKYGISQARAVARRFKKIPVDIILASDYNRTRSTTKIMNKLINKKIVYTPLLRELKKPTEIENKHCEDPEAMKVTTLMEKNKTDKNWHFSDEENFFDHKQRVEKFIDFLNKRKEENILVVSHGITIRMVVMVMIFGDLLTLDLFERVIFMRIRNTGITLCKKDHKNNWQLLTWNDYAHLG